MEVWAFHIIPSPQSADQGPLRKEFSKVENQGSRTVIRVVYLPRSIILNCLPRPSIRLKFHDPREVNANTWHIHVLNRLNRFSHSRRVGLVYSARIQHDVSHLLPIERYVD